MQVQFMIMQKWPDEPLFYANFPSISDPNMAPEGKETCFLLIPIAPGLEDSESLRKKYFDKTIIIISHRNEVLLRCDEIIKLESGKLIFHIERDDYYNLVSKNRDN